MTRQPLHNPQLDGNPFLWRGSKIGILLLHGLTATCVEVRLLAERLHDEGYTVSVPLLPGHGTTPEDLNRTGWKDWLAEATRAYTELQEICDIVFIGGESTGGALGLYMAAHYPEIAGVLAYAPALKLNVSQMERVGMYAAAPIFISVPKMKIAIREKWQGYVRYSLKAVISLLKFGKKTIKQLHKVRQPVLVVQGRFDYTVSPEVGRIIKSNVRSTLIEHHWMENSCHVILLDNELDAVAQITLDFIQRVLIDVEKPKMTPIPAG